MPSLMSWLAGAVMTAIWSAALSLLLEGYAPNAAGISPAAAHEPSHAADPASQQETASPRG
jgi:hypothetical protein